MDRGQITRKSHESNQKFFSSRRELSNPRRELSNPRRELSNPRRELKNSYRISKLNIFTPTFIISWLYKTTYSSRFFIFL